jgi:hypothetical protein
MSRRRRPWFSITIKLYRPSRATRELVTRVVFALVALLLL